jgi:type IX secretion system PorP/SprF family membrane protein
LKGSSTILFFVFFLAALTLLPSGTVAQDVHYGQQFDNDIYLNPALSGMGNKANRLLLQYRDQWRTVPVPFASAFISYDRKITAGDNQLFGAGAQLLFDRQGDGHLSTIKFSVSPSYTRLFKEKKVSLGVGFQVGMLHRFVDTDGLVFESQFDGVDINPESGEALSGSATGLDLGAGIHVAGRIGDKAHVLEGGYSMYNMHQPNLSFVENGVDERPVRFNTYAAAEIFIGSNGWSVNPVFQFQRQEKVDNILPLVYAKKYLKNDKRNMAFSFGGGYRVADAAKMYVAYEVGDFKMGLNYDLNTSGFNDATNTVGAGEILLRYEWERPKKIVIDTLAIDTTYTEDSTEIVQEEEEAVEEKEVDVVETPVVPITPDQPEPPPPPVPAMIEQINEGMGISLYFPNDYPDPGSTSPVTDKPYVQIYREYMRQSVEYYRLGGEEGNMVEFVEKFVTYEWRRYKTLMKEVRGHLRQGRTVTIQVRGYTSPLATGAYNLNLSKRRIQCVINQIKRYEDVDAWYEEGRLRIIEAPFGESKADPGVSDDSRDPRRSIYSDKASFERRVEIERVIIE